MLRKLIIFGICAGVSASLPILYQSNPEAVMTYLSTLGSDTELQSAKPKVEKSARSLEVATAQSSGGRRVSLLRDENGHFGGDFRINGRKVAALVDTGATKVAINMSTARRLGISVTAADMTALIKTANGVGRGALVVIDRMDIGRISIENVEALVLEDNALSGTLIGMTFLNRLKTFRVDGGAMTLAQ